MCKREGINGVLASHLDACQIPYQVVCERLGLPCFGTKEQFHLLTDKTAFIKTCKENGVDIIPQYEEQDFDANNNEIEYPLFVKPCDSRGSRGQSVCTKYEEMKSAIAFAKSESKTQKVIIEKYMKGKQDFSQSYLFIDGEAYLVRTGDRFLGAVQDKMDKSCILGISPSVNTELFLQNANNNVVKMLKKIGIKNGPVFMQGFIDGDKIRFYDPGLRFPGIEYDRMYYLSTGINLCKALVTFALTGLIPEEYKSVSNYEKLNEKVVFNLFIPVKSGTITKIIGIDTIKNNPKTVAFFQKYREGDYVGEHYNVNQRFCEIDMITDSREDVKQLINWVYSNLKILDEDGNDMKMSMFDTNLL